MLRTVIAFLISTDWSSGLQSFGGLWLQVFPQILDQYFNFNITHAQQLVLASSHHVATVAICCKLLRCLIAELFGTCLSLFCLPPADHFLWRVLSHSELHETGYII
ncbi:MAG: hypothetical protein HC869_10510 [Rhodospirillales bacterium]|nr:hypothetical protein [Rhodospirillales bacterium]